MALCGAGIACAYDGSLALRRLLGILMGALAAAAMTLTALCLRVDPLRAYAFAGVAAGFSLYRFSLGAFARAIHAAARRAGCRGGAR